MPLDDRYANVPFDEAISYLSGKINLDTDKWDDILDAEHDAAFVVAGAKGSLLSDLRGAVDRAIANGQRPEDFLKDFERISEGWAHTGDKAWRANIIHMTNLTQSYAAGRATYQLDPEVMRVQPYLQWVHSNSGKPRPSHLALDGRVFRAEAIPFYPPNGYGCLCRTISLTQGQVDKQGLTVDSLQVGDTLPYTDDRGKLREAVIAPDKGFARIPGRGDRRSLLEGMIAKFPTEVAKPLQEELARIDAEMAAKKKASKKYTTRKQKEKLPPPNPPKTYQEFIEWGSREFADSEAKLQKLRKSLKVDKLTQDYLALSAEIDQMKDRGDTPDTKLINKSSWARSKMSDAQSAYKTEAIKVFKAFREDMVNGGMRLSEARQIGSAVQIADGLDQATLRSQATEFFQITRGKGSTSFKEFIYAGDRAFALPGGQINVGDASAANIFHELGHHLEFESKVVLKASKDWVKSRASGPPESLKTLSGNGVYGEDEYAYPDAFYKPYVGKEYSNATEVISMGVEKFVTADEMRDLHRLDPDHFRFILGVLTSP